MWPAVPAIMNDMGTLPIVLLALFGLAQSTDQSAATPPAPRETPETEVVPTFRTGVAQIAIDVQVLNGKQVLTGLTAADFVVYDEGVQQQLLAFGRESEPMRLLLLLDVSGSMRKHLQQMAQSAKQALRYLRSGDRVGVMLFSQKTKIGEDFTDDLSLIERQIELADWDESLGSGTAINAAVMSAADYMRDFTVPGEPPRGEERRAILIVTDNLGMNYQIPDSAVLRRLFGLDIVFNAIVVGKGKRPVPPPDGVYTNPDFTPSDVFLFAEETGGEAVKAERAGETFRDVMERIRARYRLTYRVPEAPAGSFRSVRVDLSPAARQRFPNATVRHRTGYYVQ